MKLKRIHEMEAYIHSRGTVSIDELCEHFEVSKNTVRRDLDKIIQGGNVKKVYGGVVSLDIDQLQPYEKRDTKHDKQKALIGKYAASLIEEGDLVFIDSGTTTRHIAKYLNPDMALTIVTNNLDIINAVSEYPNYRIFVIGNTFKATTRSFVNVEDQGFFDRINITKAFMAASALSVERGVTNSDMLEYEIKHQIVNKTPRNFLLVDNSKFDRAALQTYASIDTFEGIITDLPPTEKYIEYCEAHDVALYYPAEG